MNPEKQKIGRLASIQNGPERNVKLTISATEVYSEISSPAGTYDPRSIDYYEISGLQERGCGLVRLTLVLADRRRVRFYCTEEKLDMVLLLDELDATIGPRKRNLLSNKGTKVRRRLTGVLCGFLDAFVSRNSDYDGYWIFGFLAGEAYEVSFGLLSTNSNAEGPSAFSTAARIAQSKFAELLEKSRIPMEFVSQGRVIITKLEPATLGLVNGRTSNGHLYSIRAEVMSDLRKQYTASKVIFIASHDPSVEQRSRRRNDRECQWND